MSTTRYLPAARYVAQAIPGILARLGLRPFISRYVLTETHKGHAWLFVVLEVGPLNHPDDYAASDVLDHLSTSLHGLPVVISESYGMRYAVLIGSGSGTASVLPQLGETNITWQMDVPEGPIL
jgi:hypothetical protein